MDIKRFSIIGRGNKTEGIWGYLGTLTLSYFINDCTPFVCFAVVKIISSFVCCYCFAESLSAFYSIVLAIFLDETVI